MLGISIPRYKRIYMVYYKRGKYEGLLKEKCFYCDMPLTKKCIEYDHFPYPRRISGKEIVLVCTNCHNLKDRISIYDIQTFWLKDLYNLWNKYTPTQKIYLAKITCTINDYLSSINNQKNDKNNLDKTQGTL